MPSLKASPPDAQANGDVSVSVGHSKPKTHKNNKKKTMIINLLKNWVADLAVLKNYDL